MSSNERPRRNYIQRKKCLNASVTQIRNILNFIQMLQKDNASPIETQKVALAHAQKIEAACWSPHSKLTPEYYEKLISVKTVELCRVLLKKSIPQMDSSKIQQLKDLILQKATNFNTDSLNGNNDNSINMNINNILAKAGNTFANINLNNCAINSLPEINNSNNKLSIMDKSTQNLTKKESLTENISKYSGFEFKGLTDINNRNFNEVEFRFDEPIFGAPSETILPETDILQYSEMDGILSLSQIF
ncbi:hypothetical protein TRFO_35099 [Tritrichomonas foetus]|uniref:Uncharacterized protein n=1 Tax=Tritrichomonas foetus TaxID=1144522 RepID=A0A1J4JIF5_9EUKA|nr:hypothetical protein TRFO_35099 [Tritrichomonas foetus]|eukprot:OHS98473.1 hypothetical protein TRFO_35099 [Tritrichomonas foetus]